MRLCPPRTGRNTQKLPPGSVGELGAAALAKGFHVECDEIDDVTECDFDNLWIVVLIAQVLEGVRARGTTLLPTRVNYFFFGRCRPSSLCASSGWSLPAATRRSSPSSRPSTSHPSSSPSPSSAVLRSKALWSAACWGKKTELPQETPPYPLGVAL